MIKLVAKVAKEKSQLIADSWEQVGKPEIHEGGRGGDTIYTHYRCNLCGSRWLKTRDSGGLGGHNTFFERE